MHDSLLSIFYSGKKSLKLLNNVTILCGGGAVQEILQVLFISLFIFSSLAQDYRCLLR